MGRLMIDQDKCEKDGFCVADCPVAIIRLGEDDGCPELVPGGEDTCLECGHCVAVCPHGALSHWTVPIEDCPAIEKELVISEHQAVQLLRSRRSIRVFQDKPVEKEKIERLIEIASFAPTGSNTQLVEWLVFTDKEKIKELAGTTVDWMRFALQEDPDNAPYFLGVFTAAWDAGQDPILRNAPALIVAIAPEEIGNGIVDPTIALSHLELVAPTLGLGTCWAGALRRALLNWEPAREAMGLADGYPFYYPMMLGYPRFSYHRMPKRNSPKISWR
jgi:nitroreductase/NAD-dependent dihydropyrimidine dehydrogenase PreA subunit